MSTHASHRAAIYRVTARGIIDVTRTQHAHTVMASVRCKHEEEYTVGIAPYTILLPVRRTPSQPCECVCVCIYINIYIYIYTYVGGG